MVKTYILINRKPEELWDIINGNKDYISINKCNNIELPCEFYFYCSSPKSKPNSKPFLVPFNGVAKNVRGTVFMKAYCSKVDSFNTQCRIHNKFYIDKFEVIDKFITMENAHFSHKYYEITKPPRDYAYIDKPKF